MNDQLPKSFEEKTTQSPARSDAESPGERALFYTRLGMRVLPLHSITEQGRCTCRKEGCSNAGKHPLRSNWLNEATTEVEMIVRWWSESPWANVGIATGKGLLVIDFDPRHGGMPDVLQRLVELPQTLRVQTGGDGYHFYYGYDPAKHTLKNTVGKIAPGIDTRADGGFVVAPPSLHVSGNAYRTLPGYNVPVPAPESLLALHKEVQGLSMLQCQQRHQKAGLLPSAPEPQPQPAPERKQAEGGEVNLPRGQAQRLLDESGWHARCASQHLITLGRDW